MKVIGLTGGIATGVSTVAQMFRELGAVVIEADKIARDVVVPGTDPYGKIVETFGREILSADGTIDRRRLGQIIFADGAARRRLNVITHPAIHRRIAEEVERLRETRPDAVVILDVPLLLDTTGPDSFDMEGVIVVVADPKTQAARLIERDGLSREEVERRLASQRPAAEKAAEAEWVIQNAGSIDETRRQVAALWQRLKGEA